MTGCGSTLYTLTGVLRPRISISPIRSEKKEVPMAARVIGPMYRWLGGASSCSREATLTVSPTTVNSRWLLAPTYPAITGPV